MNFKILKMDKFTLIIGVIIIVLIILPFVMIGKYSNKDKKD